MPDSSDRGGGSRTEGESRPPPYAVLVFLVSLIAMVIAPFHNYVLSNGMEVVGDAFSLGFTAVIFLIAVALFLYARRMQKRGVLV